MMKKLRIEIRKRTTLAISGAFALVIALVWNETIKAIVGSFVTRMKIPETFYWHQIAVAVFVTFVWIIGIMISSKETICLRSFLWQNY